MRAGPVVLMSLGKVMLYAGPAFVLPAIIALAYDPHDLSLLGFTVPGTAVVFLATGALVSALGQLLIASTRQVRYAELNDKQSYMVVAASWLVMSILAGMPFLLTFNNPIDAWFEAMSGVTATGATALRDIEATTPSLLFHRSMLQWLGGFAFIVVGIALITRLTHAGAQLLAVDITAAGKRLRPRVRETARAMAPFYGGFTAIMFTAYFATMYWTGVRNDAKGTFLDAIIHAFSTVSAGGFSNYTRSIAHFDSAWVEAVAVIGMLVAGTSFALIYYVRKDPRKIIQDREWRAMMLFFGFASFAAVGLLMLSGGSAGNSVRAGIFSVISTATTTGFAVADHDHWPTLARSLLLVTMFSGAMAGSAAGGLKILRITILLKIARRELRKLLHPRAIIAVRHGGRGLSEDTLLTVIAFFFSFITAWIVGAVLLIASEPHLGIFDGAGASAAAMANVGPAMGVVGPFDTYAELHASSRAVLATLMWVGRLEVFAVLLFLSPSSWKS